MRAAQRLVDAGLGLAQADKRSASLGDVEDQIVEEGDDDEALPTGASV